MTLPIKKAIESRVSINHFQLDRSLADETITSLVRLATKAPSAYNMQNWRFIAVRSDAAKMRLKAAAFEQQKIADASVTFIVCGTLAAYKQLGAALEPSVDAGIMEQHEADGWVAQASATHESNTTLQRDEAIRSASLAAMTLMLAAEEMGLGSCPMSGFDAEKVAQAFELSHSELPVMIVAVGYPESGNWPQKPRKALTETLSIV